MKQHDAFDQAEELCEFHKKTALEMLDQLPAGESKPALRALTNAFAA